MVNLFRIDKIYYFLEDGGLNSVLQKAMTMIFVRL